MLWYKSWLDTRWRFLLGLTLLICSGGAAVASYPSVVKLMPLMPSVDVGGELGRRIKEVAELSREYRGYIWAQWIGQTLMNMATLFAVLLGTGGQLSKRGGALFTLSLPASRDRLLGIRAATGLAELMALAFIPLLLVPAFSAAIGQSYSVVSALAHGLCLFVAAAAFFSLAFLLSTMFGDLWRPLMIALAAAIAIGGIEQFARDLSPYSVFGLMSGEVYFRTGHLPWIGLVVGASASAAEGEFRVPFTLTRKGEARFEAPPKSAAIGKELEGTWDGTLDVDGKQVRLVLTLANQPDGTSSGTIVTPERGNLEFRVSNITQAASRLSLDIKAAGAMYVGTLNDERTELVGTYHEGAVELPLTFRRLEAQGLA